MGCGASSPAPLKTQNDTYGRRYGKLNYRNNYQQGYQPQNHQPQQIYYSSNSSPNYWYPNQPPGLASYNHGIAVINPPLVRPAKSETSAPPLPAGMRTKTNSSTTKPAIKTKKSRTSPKSKPTGKKVKSKEPSSKSLSQPAGNGNASLSIDKDEAELWKTGELSGEPEPVEELEEPHPDHALILGVTEDYEAFKKKFKSISDGKLYEDPDFPADNSSLFRDENKNDNTEWKRPFEICEKPRMFVDGTSREDVVQGELADCWFLASCAGIAPHKDLIKKIIPEYQSLCPPNYIGAIHFRFWRFGRWVDVVIDDRLPTRNNKLRFASSSETNEFWPALMEKAYAKLNGTYLGLAGGMAADAFVDLTGGLSEVFLFTQESVSPDFYCMLYQGIKTQAFLSCSQKNPNWKNVTADDSGIVSGHAYTITDAQVVYLEKKKKVVKLLRVRNPWGNATEWQGDWSDNSSMWKKISKTDTKKLNPQQKDDGEFWMCFEDFCKKFNSVIMCTLGPDFDGDGTADMNEAGGGFCVADMRGHWIKNVSAGGCTNHDTFYNNPQFSFILLHPDDAHSSDSNMRGKCSIIIAVMQEYRRSKKNLAPKRHQIGFKIFQTDDPSRPQSRHEMEQADEVGRSGSFINYRQVYRRFTLYPGSYNIVPSTFLPNTPSSFMVRLFTEKKAIFRSLGSFIGNTR
ncbi:calpain-A-like [Asterias amurensis]|uniref:calpain-A-like n=1 Tax=Asterias amurensis TaxID=7602 RepID=UPI003AB7084B